MKLDGTLNRKARQPERTCAKKKVYRTGKEAADKAILYRSQGLLEQYVYQCKTCWKYHLTKMKPEAMEDGRLIWQMK
jgi:hypothetical protein